MDDPSSAQPIRFELKDIPSPRPVLARVISMVSDPDFRMERLTTVVASDPAFAAEIIRSANSPFYGLHQEVRTAGRAIVQLGARTVRCLAICFAARDVVREAFEAEDLADFWEDSLRRAVAARRIARMGKSCDPEEAFTAGLLLEFGLLALVQMNPQTLPAWRALRRELPEVRRNREAQIFGTTHDRVARLLGTQWGLPEGLIVAISHHHHPRSPTLSGTTRALATVAGLADLVASVYGAQDAQSAIKETARAFEEEYRLGRREVDAFLASIAGDVTTVATALGFNVRKQPSYDEILINANRALAAMNVSYEELTVRLERTIREKEELAVELQRANQKLQELVYFDPLTGLANRRRFEETFLRELGRLASQPVFLTVLLLDLDHFKRVNDNYGHTVGDEVLKAVGGALFEGTRATDVKARFGGEELALLLPDTPEAEGRMLAERVRTRVEALSIPGQDGQIVRVTVSVGGMTLQGPSREAGTGPERMRAVLDRVDRALYRAKHQGRNQVVWAGPNE